MYNYIVMGYNTVTFERWLASYRSVSEWHHNERATEVRDALQAAQSNKHVVYRVFKEYEPA